MKKLEKVLEKQKFLKEWNNITDLKDLSKLRHEINVVCDVVNEVLDIIPKKDSWPEFEDFIHTYN